MRRQISCSREGDVLDLVAIGQWPSRADRDLSEHVAGCAVCADLAAVAAQMAGLGETALMAVRLPDSSAVWYRAQLAAREDLARRAARPMVAAEIAAGVAVVGAGILVWQAGGDALGQLWSGLDVPFGGSFSEFLGGLSNTGITWRWVAFAFAAWIALIPAAFSLAHFADRSADSPSRRETRA